MTKTIQLYVANASAGATSAAITYLNTVKGKITSILWQMTGTGNTGGYQSAELSLTPTYQQLTNDPTGVISGCVNNSTSGGGFTATTQIHNGFAFEINPGDRLYLNLYNATALTAGTVRVILTVAL